MLDHVATNMRRLPQPINQLLPRRPIPKISTNNNRSTPNKDQILIRSLVTLKKSRSPTSPPSFGFSGAGFLGCYHVGAAACLHRHGWLPHPDDRGSGGKSMPLITGVSAGSMIASAILAGVDPDPDGMEVVLEAARRTRNTVRAVERSEKLNNNSKNDSDDLKKSAKNPDFALSLDVFTPGFSLIDQVEGPFREAMIKSLGGTIPDNKDTIWNATNSASDTTTSDDKNAINNNSNTLYDIDPELFSQRFPPGTLRIGLADRQALWPSIRKSNILEAYRYVDTFRNLEDVLASCMLSSYIPGGTGPLKLSENIPGFLGGMLSGMSGFADNNHNDAADRAGRRLREMKRLGMVKHGLTGLVDDVKDSKVLESEDGNNVIRQYSTDYWDGGLVDVFPTFDENTVIVTPVNGLFDPNPAICPLLPSTTETESIVGNPIIEGEVEQQATSNDFTGNTPSSSPSQSSWQSNLILRNIFQSYLPQTFRHCSKSRLGINSKNVSTALRMMFSSEDEELYLRFREGYDDTRRFLDQRGQLRVFTG